MKRTKKNAGISASEVLAFSKAIIAHVKKHADAEIAAKDAEIARLRAELDEARRQTPCNVVITSDTVVGPLPKHPHVTPTSAAAAQWLADEVRRIKTDAGDRRIREGDDE